MAKSKKLNTMRWLEQQNIAYTVIEFDERIHSAQGVADFANVPPEMVFKTLVLIAEDEKPMLVLIAASHSLDLKKLARASGQKKVRMASHDEAEKLTGLKTGGISSLALIAKNWPIYIDETATHYEEILMSAGQRGINLRLSSQAYIEALKVKVIDCTSPLEF